MDVEHSIYSVPAPLCLFHPVLPIFSVGRLPLRVLCFIRHGYVHRVIIIGFPAIQLMLDDR